MKHVALLSIVALLGAFARADQALTPIGVGSRDSSVETIQQRDASGRVRVSRQVRLAENGDYVNHGSWRSWDAAGELVGQGRYAWGKPTGVWSRWADAEDAPLLSTVPFADFDGPFLSQATYRDGQLVGSWSVFDAGGRLVSEVAFRNGQRHGKAELRTPDGAVWRRTHFEAGVQVGSVQQRDDAGRLETIAVFQDGRERSLLVEQYETEAMKCREAWLGPRQEATQADDPWRLQLARYEPVGDAVRDGRRETWWPNGQPKLRAEYRLGKAVGEARWWHENGQLALRGSYDAGVADGEWAWWRETGGKAAACRYAAGRLVEEFRVWTADGRAMDRAPQRGLVSRPGDLLIR